MDISLMLDGSISKIQDKVMVCYHLCFFGVFSPLKFLHLGKDGNHVFFMGQIVHHADSFSFQIIDDQYAKDHQYVFQYGQIVDTHQSPCFHPPIKLDLSHAYADTNVRNPTILKSSSAVNIYLMPDGLISPIQVKVTVCFHLPNNRLSSLDFFQEKIYIMSFSWEKLSEDANAFSFEVLNKGYAKDKKLCLLQWTDYSRSDTFWFSSTIK